MAQGRHFVRDFSGSNIQGADLHAIPSSIVARATVTLPDPLLTDDFTPQDFLSFRSLHFEPKRILQLGIRAIDDGHGSKQPVLVLGVRGLIEHGERANPYHEEILGEVFPGMHLSVALRVQIDVFNFDQVVQVTANSSTSHQVHGVGKSFVITDGHWLTSKQTSPPTWVRSIS